MELPFGTEGRRATHDFLSLYSSSSAHAQQDPAPPQGGYLKTQNFLQPLERVGKNATATKGEGRGEMAAVEKPPVPGPPTSVEQLLPGGIGTYSISYFNQRPFKPEGSLYTTAQAISSTRHDENSNCSSYPGNGFTLWDESSAVKKGKTGKENIIADRHVLPGAIVVGRQWPSPSSSNHNPTNATFSSFSSSQPSSSQKNQSFMDMIASAKNDQDEDDEEDEEEFVIKNETSSHQRGNLSIKVEAKTIDQKPNTPRSKHSATEQRRRSKINDRFQKLREVIPNIDQKKDKASFLLEVIEYIQFLQEKVNRFESSYNLWSHEPSKMMQWRNCHIAEGLINHLPVAKTECDPALVFATKCEENRVGSSPSIPVNGQNIIDSDMSTATTFNEKGHQPELASKAAPVPNIFPLGRTSIPASPVSPKQASNTDQTMTWHPSQFQQKRSHTPDCTSAGNKTIDKEPTIESGTIHISSSYSQGLLNTLTQALSKSRVDLSQASISVQIDLRKKANGIPLFSSSAAKDDGNPTVAPHMREDFDNALKKLRTS